MRTIRGLVQKYGEVIRYLAVGGMTTLLDSVCFAALAEWAGVGIEAAKVITWMIAVSFAFAGNKWVVFRTKTKNGRALLGEAMGFYASRLFSLGFALLFNHVAVRIWLWNGSVANVVSNVFVIVINYLLGKLVVFRKQ